MFIETYIALAMLVILLPIAILIHANRNYQAERWVQRFEQRRDRLVDEDDEYHVYLQIREDTCVAHGVFCCDRCFDTA